MKVGDLVRHNDGDIGLVIKVDLDDVWYPYYIFFRGGPAAWFAAACFTKVTSEDR